MDINFTSTESNSSQLKKFEPGHLKWDIQAKSNALFVISESYFKPGWKAYLNDSIIPIYKANHIHMAVLIPEGEHQLRLEFEPESFNQYAAIEKIVLYLLYIFLLSHIVRNNRSKIPYLKSVK